MDRWPEATLIVRLAWRFRGMETSNSNQLWRSKRSTLGGKTGDGSEVGSVVKHWVRSYMASRPHDRTSRALPRLVHIGQQRGSRNTTTCWNVITSSHRPQRTLESCALPVPLSSFPSDRADECCGIADSRAARADDKQPKREERPSGDDLWRGQAQPAALELRRVPSAAARGACRRRRHQLFEDRDRPVASGGTSPTSTAASLAVHAGRGRGRRALDSDASADPDARAAGGGAQAAGAASARGRADRRRSEDGGGDPRAARAARAHGRHRADVPDVARGGAPPLALAARARDVRGRRRRACALARRLRGALRCPARRSEGEGGGGSSGM